MQNALSPVPEREMNHLSVHEMEQQFGKAMSGNDAVKLSVQSKEQGDFDLEMDAYPSILIYKTRFIPEIQDFQMPLYREEPTLNLMFQEKGSSSFGSGKKSVRMSPNQHTLQFFPGIDCSWNIQNDEPVHYLNIKLKVDYFKDYVIENQHLGGWFYEKMERNELVSASAKELVISPEIRTILYQIKNCPYNATFKWLFIDGLIKVLLTHQLDEYNQLFLHKKPVWQDQKINVDDVGKLHEIKQYVSQRYLDSLSLFHLSRHFTINEFKLKYGFRKLFGISVMQYVYEMRLNHSKKLLLETSKSINDISQIVGYEHPNNFSASFKRKFGHSPTVFRKRG